MELLDKILNFNVLEWIGAVVVLLNALIGLFMLIPGEQPEKFLKSIVDLVGKLSIKKPE